MGFDPSLLKKGNQTSTVETGCHESRTGDADPDLLWVVDMANVAASGACFNVIKSGGKRDQFRS
jgi:hypothetical protein